MQNNQEEIKKDIDTENQIDEYLINKQINKMEKKTNYGAWKKTTPKGEVIEFTIEDKRYSMWLNQYKKPYSKEADYKIYPNDYKPKAENKMEYQTPVNQQESEDDLPY
jgi:hypothetical protein